MGRGTQEGDFALLPRVTYRLLKRETCYVMCCFAHPHWLYDWDWPHLLQVCVTGVGQDFIDYACSQHNTQAACEPQGDGSDCCYWQGT